MANYPELTSKVVVVTGGVQGIGRAIAREFSANGAAVAIADLNGAGAEQRAVELRASGGRALAVTADVSRSEDVSRLFATVAAELGPVDVLVNNAGYVRPYSPENLIHNMSEEDWDRIVAINLKSVFLCTRAVVNEMMARKSGRIINIASNVGRLIDFTTASHYAAAKAGVLQLTRHVAREMAPHGITVNAICPGVTESPRAQTFLSQELRQQILTLTPVGRLADPEDMAGAALFLASDGARYITGATIDVAGGRVML
ncbi:MAG: glucose 1-dehydrogenase [Chloroflexi bacterium]|nr:glucose 1-dehydrogenase [Chloroflexota bacterium]